MGCNCKCECLLPWLSGLVSAPAICHLIRILAGWELIINGKAISMKTSWIVFTLSGLTAIILGIISCRTYKNKN